MFVAQELSRQISEILPKLQASVEKQLAGTTPIPVPEEEQGLRAKILLSIGDIKVLIKKLKQGIGGEKDD